MVVHIYTIYKTCIIYIYIVNFFLFFFFKIWILAQKWVSQWQCRSEWLAAVKGHGAPWVGHTEHTWALPAPVCPARAAAARHIPGCSGALFPDQHTHLQYFPNKRRLGSERHLSHSLFSLQLSPRAGFKQSVLGHQPGGGGKALTSLIAPNRSKVSKCIIKKISLWHPYTDTPGLQHGVQKPVNAFWNPSQVVKKV